jgi:hypothetical protein
MLRCLSMQGGFALLLVTALAAQIPAAQPGKPLTLELRVFNGSDEVTAETRAMVHRAGDRTIPPTHAVPSAGRMQLTLPPDLYDVQAIHEREGRVLNIRWANRLVLMPYPDEPGHHLEVINFKNGFGALQVRDASGRSPDVALYEAGVRDKPAATAIAASDYLLFVIRSGQYDLLTRGPGKPAWHLGVDVPLDRTRLWVTP